MADGIDTGWWGPASVGLSTIGDIYSVYQNAQNQQKQNQLFGLQTDPTKLAAMAGAFMPQYSPAAIDVVNRGINADWASATGGAPGGASAQHLTDSWAKLVSGNWFNALNAALSSANQAKGVIPQNQPMGFLQNALKVLMTLKGLGGPKTGISETPGVATTGGGVNPNPLSPEAEQGGGYEQILASLGGGDYKPASGYVDLAGSGVPETPVGIDLGGFTP